MFWPIIALTAVSGIASAVGGAQQAAAQNRAASANAAASRNNAANARIEATYARTQAEKNAAEARAKAATLIGAQRAKMGASGAVVDSGSFMDVIQSTAEQGEVSAVNALQDGDMEAWRQNTRAGQYDRQASAFAASHTNPNAVLVGGLLSGAANTGLTAFTMSNFTGGSNTAKMGMDGALSGNPGYTDQQLKALGAI